MLRRNECRLNFQNRPVRTGDIKGGPKQPPRPPLPLIGVARSLPLIGLIENYGKQWAITFSVAKTICQTFSNHKRHFPPTLTFGGQEIPSVDSHRHLGLNLSNDLRFHDHVNEIIRKVNIALSHLYPISSKLPRQVLGTIYTTYIRPYFDYCDVVFDGHMTAYDERRFETLQNRAARLITGALFRTSTDKLRHELGWDRLSTRREIHRLTYFWSLNDRTTPTPAYIRDSLPQARQTDTTRTLRNSTAMTQPKNRTTRFQKSFIPDTTRKWNKLPLAVRPQSSLNTFKSDISKLLGPQHPPKYKYILIQFQTGKRTAHTAKVRHVLSKLTHLSNTENDTSLLSLRTPYRNHTPFCTTLPTIYRAQTQPHPKNLRRT